MSSLITEEGKWATKTACQHTSSMTPRGGDKRHLRCQSCLHRLGAAFSPTEKPRGQYGKPHVLFTCLPASPLAHLPHMCTTEVTEAHFCFLPLCQLQILQHSFPEELVLQNPITLIPGKSNLDVYFLQYGLPTEPVFSLP